MTILASKPTDPKERAKLASIATRFYLASVMLAKSHPDSTSPDLIRELNRIKVQAAADRDHLLVTCRDRNNPPRLGPACCDVVKFAALGIAHSLSSGSSHSAKELLSRLHEHLSIDPDDHFLEEFVSLLQPAEAMPRAA
jgi:hypothetical protein